MPLFSAIALGQIGQWLRRSLWQLVIATMLVIFLTSIEFGSANNFVKPDNFIAASGRHPLPFTLMQWQDVDNSGDYFERVKLTEVGYLVWSQFPVKVYIDTTQLQERLQAIAAVQEWNIYLPLQIVEQKEIADIKIIFRSLPLGMTNFLRARSALTRYELYINSISTSAAVLAHRCTIFINPNQSSKYIKAAALHEVGHALGIWGHSLVISDALYFSQVSNPPSISARDINTLKLIYHQPTLLGWKVAVQNTGSK